MTLWPGAEVLSHHSQGQLPHRRQRPSDRSKIRIKDAPRSSALLPLVGEQFGANTMLKHVYCHPVEMMLAAGSFCMGGILERHPRLRVAFLEGNCGWVPFLMWRMDEHWERQATSTHPN